VQVDLLSVRRVHPNIIFLFVIQSHMVAHMNIYSKTFALILILSSAWLAGCEQHIRIDGSWQEGVPRDQSFKRILVVGVSPNANGRCDFEHFMATQLTSESVIAKSSCNFMPINDPLTIESIDKVVVEEQADAVFATILVDSKVAAKEGGMNETRGSGDYKAIGTGYGYGGYYGGFGRYGVPVTYVDFQTTAPITTIDGEVEILSRLYEVNDGAVVYELKTKASDLQSTDQGLAAITAPIAERMRRDGVIR
jgi:hypothetical protein